MTDDGTHERGGGTILAVFLSVLVLVYIFGAYAAAGGAFRDPFTTAAPAGITALVTIAYVLFTYWMVQETSATRKETEQAREDANEARKEARRLRRLSVEPAFTLDLIRRYAGISGVTLKNIGSGPARQIEAKILHNDGEKQKKITSKNVEPGEGVPVDDPFGTGDITHMLEGDENISVVGTYVDATGHKSDFSVVFGEHVAPTSEDVSTPSHEQQIENALRDIAKELKD